MTNVAISILKNTILAAAIAISTVGAAVAADKFGAIAFSKSTGAYGFSYDHQSRRDAEARAMSECKSRSRGCMIGIWFKNACGSVALGTNGWGSAWAGSRGNAEGAAVANCSKHTGNCRVLAWTCTAR